MLVNASDQTEIWRERAAGMADLMEGLEVCEDALDARVGEQRERTSTEQEAGGEEGEQKERPVVSDGGQEIPQLSSETWRAIRLSR